jgi:hypothetical protein
MQQPHLSQPDYSNLQSLTSFLPLNRQSILAAKSQQLLEQNVTKKTTYSCLTIEEIHFDR